VTERRPNRVRGPAHDDFWAWCDRGELRIQRCDACGHLSWPATASCEKCGSSELSWQATSGNGRVVSWCTFHRPYYAELGVPWTTILVELTEGPLFISNPVGFDHDDISFGMPVRVSFIDCEDADGAFRLPVFERA
jgi:uncharacterized protein